jgi:broad specificity phosphatase PhoE
MKISRAVTDRLTTRLPSEPARILLVRHGATDALGRSLSGRAAGVTLNDEGRAQVTDLGRRLASRPVRAVLSSPLERARATAEAIARPHNLTVRVFETLNEVDFGQWTGRSFDELSGSVQWLAYNARRASAVVPGGESPGALQARAISSLRQISAEYAGSLVVAVSHAEFIRAALAHSTGVSLDRWQDFDLPPASITELVIDV